MAEREGFEPSRDSTPLDAFEAPRFGRSRTSPGGAAYQPPEASSRGIRRGYPRCVPKIKAATVEEHRLATIDRLLDAFGSLVLERGYTGLSFADIAQAAGLARTAVYNYFPDLESMLFAWTEREVANAMAALEGEVRGAETSAEQLRIFVKHQLQGFATRHLPPGQEVMRFLNPETFGRFMSHIEPLERIVSEIIKRGLENGEFKGTDAETAVPMVMACIGTKRGEVASDASTLDSATDQLTSFLLRALGA
jgi:AcrR family transcriptional regulator